MTARIVDRLCVLVAILCCMVFGSLLEANEKISNLESRADQWIDLQIKASRERSEWNSERVLLESSIHSLEAEKELLHEEVAANKLAVDLYSKNRDKLKEALTEKEEALATLKNRLEEFETRLVALLPSFPEPLSKDIRPLIGKLGSEIDGRAVSIATRTQSLVTILSSIDQFNNSLTVTHQIRKGADGGEFDTRVMYWGLAFGYAVDSSGERAWRLSPSVDGWDWAENPEIAPDLIDLLEIYERNQEPKLVTLPVSLAKGGAQ